MARVKLNPVLEGMHGKIGDLVFKQFQHETIVARTPEQVHQPNSPAQLAAREKFRLAVFYGKTAFADPAAKALYTDKARQNGTPVFAMMVADFINAPVIDEVDLSAYAGQSGNPIRIRASDDFDVTGVTVQMREPDSGEPIDGGAAVRGSDNIWVFTAQANIPHDHPFVIEVSATDRPGHKTLNTQTHVVH